MLLRQKGKRRRGHDGSAGLVRDTNGQAKTPNFSFEPKNMTEAMEFAKILSQSDLVPSDYKGKPGNILVV